MKRFKTTLLIATLALMGIAGTANAQQNKEVFLEKAGTLEKQLTAQEMSTIKQIVVHGNINSADVAVLKRMATENVLENISLEKAQWVQDEAPKDSLADDPVLNDANEYFLPNIDILGKNWEAEQGEQYELNMGHVKDSRSMPGFWMFTTGKKLFFMTGYMNGWENTIDEAVIKSENADYIRSKQVKKWIEGMGYSYIKQRDDGDDVYYNSTTKIYVLLHYTPYNKSDYPGIHFSKVSYDY